MPNREIRIASPEMAPLQSKWLVVVGVCLAAGCGSSATTSVEGQAPAPATPAPSGPETPTQPRPDPPPDPPGTVDEDARGFVLTYFGYAFPDESVEACPDGFTLGSVERRQLGQEPLPDDCQEPTRYSDPEFKTMDADIPYDGFDLDGRVSTKNHPLDGECAHDDWVAPDGTPGIDFQFWRAVGCVRGFQEGEISDIVQASAVKNGSMTMLVEVVDAESEENDPDVGVQVFTSLDTPQSGATGDILPYSTLNAHPDSHYHSTVGRGTIEEGVLLAGPMEIVLRLNIQIVTADLPLHDAYVRMEFAEDGSVKGRIYGFWNVSDVYEVFGIQVDSLGADALSYTCSGLYAALWEHADGGYDAATGSCSALSMGFQFDAVPAFVAKGAAS